MTTALEGIQVAKTDILAAENSLDNAKAALTVVEALVQPPPASLVAPGVCLRATDQATMARAFALGAKMARFEVTGANQEFNTVGAACQAAGVTPLPLVTYPFVHGAPTSSALAKYGVKVIQLGNEIEESYKNPTAAEAAAYAHDLKTAAEALKPLGVGVLAICDDGNTGNPWFFEAMLQAVPNLLDLIAGAAIQPYPGLSSAVAEDTKGVPWLARTIATLKKHEKPGQVTPIHVTEWGIPSLSASTNGIFSWAEAAQAAERIIPKLIATAEGRMRTFCIYQSEDETAPDSSNREHDMGIIRAGTAGTKGPYTVAIEQFLATGAFAQKASA